ncbi:hypothetical protein F8388_018215 [Cannabis sativa]|uniref:Uncharacterized protein n=1 Tax=Cannabis sativa TaxID=3483 RepID=A0A7J6GAW2_CANSA|nr:hypothetical protein F8388_018215 [Cannabis sativa]
MPFSFSLCSLSLSLPENKEENVAATPLNIKWTRRELRGIDVGETSEKRIVDNHQLLWRAETYYYILFITLSHIRSDHQDAFI